jgi:ubiquinol-cytochrome c reductase cytochrome c1 subunit
MQERSIMKRIIVSLLAALSFVGGAMANTAGPAWDKFPKERVTDVAALQHGAKLFVNYCLNCHAAAFMRYNRMHDIDLTDEQIKRNLLFAGDKVGDLMTVAMNAKDAKAWFGAQPPDLTVIARSRAGDNGSGADYLYTYLRTFYRDDTRPSGWNNLVFPGVGMPNPLWMLQGERAANFQVGPDPADPAVKLKTFVGYTQLTKGAESASEYDSTVADLVAYMQWMAEPDQLLRKRLGVIVLIFLGLFSFITWKLKSEYWKDVT